MRNDNRQYTRGRFYTLELDLSCTRNKFPIKDRSQAMPILTRQVSAGGSAAGNESTSSELNYSTVTKSLAASMAKPVGSLYCEKRLQSSKSEAVLGAGAAGSGAAVSCGVGSWQQKSKILEPLGEDPVK